MAEIGTDMSRFPTAGHLASWAGMCPGNHESAGKRQTGKTRKGSPWLRTPWSRPPTPPGAQHLPRRPVPPPGRPPRQEEGRRRRRPLDPRHRLPPPQGRRDLRRPRRRLLRPPRPRRPRAPPRRPPRSARQQGHHRARRRLTTKPPAPVSIFKAGAPSDEGSLASEAHRSERSFACGLRMTRTTSTGQAQDDRDGFPLARRELAPSE